MERFARTEMLLGTETVQKLAEKNVIVFGIGGVGSHAVESLARTGIGNLTIVDHDTVAETNINRQLIALESTIGRPKVEVMKERVLDINPNININALQEFYSPDRGEYFINPSYDFVIDAVDNVSAKIDIIYRCKKADIPVISSMGAGNRINPQTLVVADISETSTCPLARVVRRELRKRGVETGVLVVYSPEAPVEIVAKPQEELAPGKNSIPGSISFVPAVAGYYLAYYVVNYFAQSTKL